MKKENAKKRVSALLTLLAICLTDFAGCDFSDEIGSDYNYMTGTTNNSDTANIENRKEYPYQTASENTFHTSLENYDHDRLVWEGLPKYNRDFFSEPDFEPSLVFIDEESIIQYDTARRKFKDECNHQAPSLCLFGRRMSAGFDMEDNPIPIEAYFGITAQVENQTVCVKVYDYIGEKAMTLYQIECLDKGSGITAALPSDTVADDYIFIDTSNFGNGLYRITAKFSNGKAAILYFYVNGDEVWLCRVAIGSNSSSNAAVDRIYALNRLIKENEISPENSLSLDGIHYPVKASDKNHRCDTESWAQLSKDIVEEDWSDERKLFTLYEWMRQNLAYDYYQYENLIAARSDHYGIFDGTYSVLNTHAGSCLDFSHILLIMCRANGIPAVTLDSYNQNHSWNAVYINDHWIELDMTYGIMNALYTEDTDNIVYSDSNKVMGFGIIPNASLYMPDDTSVNRFLRRD